MCDKLWRATLYLFDRPADEFMTDELFDRLSDKADFVVSKYGWNAVFKSWYRYLIERCKTPESVVEYANKFRFYGGCDQKVPEPYKFVAYFYYITNMEPRKYDGFGHIRLMTEMIFEQYEDYNDDDFFDEDGNYWSPEPLDINPETDPLFLTEIAKWRETMGQPSN